MINGDELTSSFKSGAYVLAAAFVLALLLGVAIGLEIARLW